MLEEPFIQIFGIHVDASATPVDTPPDTFPIWKEIANDIGSTCVECDEHSRFSTRFMSRIGFQKGREGLWHRIKHSDWFRRLRSQAMANGWLLPVLTLVPLPSLKI